MELSLLPQRLQDEYNTHRNAHLDVHHLRSRDKIEWVDQYQHCWVSSLSNRLYLKQNCPYCAGKQVLAGFNDLATTHPNIAAQWHPVLNRTKTPVEISSGSNYKAWWKCEQGHEWVTAVAKRTLNNTNCPVCTNRTVLQGYNDLATTHPGIATQWHPTRNGDTTPSMVTAGSSKQHWWKCENNHEWFATVAKRTQGQQCPVCQNHTVITGYNDTATTNPELIPQWHPTKNQIQLNEVTAGSGVLLMWVCSQGHEWTATVKDRAKLHHQCPTCTAKQKSRAEEHISSYLQSLQIHTLTNHRNIIPGYELDIYLPEKQVGIEFNGVYWHSEAAGKTKHYHESKYLKAKQAGIQLIQIWEDDWNRNPDLIKRLLAHKLGVNDQPVVFARKTRVEVLTTATVRVFLDANHIQGFAAGTHYLGLRDIETQALVAVMVLKKEPNHPGTLNIIRYATSTRVPGGFTKLLKHAEQEHQPDKFITFADHCISDGGLYEANGFVADKVLPPDYMYLVGRVRKHKFGYRLKKFRDDPTLKYQEGLTERELAALNGLVRVWDAGKTRYVKQVQ